MNPYYQQNGITIYHGDCLEVMPALLTAPDLIFTSPPYNLGNAPWRHLGNWKRGDSVGGKSKWRNGSDASSGPSYVGHDDTMAWNDYVAWQHECLNAMWKAIGDKGAIFYNHKPRVIGAKLWLPLELNPGLSLRQIVIWARAGGMNFNATAFVPTYEWIMVFAKEGWRLKSKGASGIGDVWRVPQERNPGHPAPFPVALPAKAIDATAPKLVLDPFAGIGSTLCAAKLARVEAIGIEKSEQYCELAAKRLSQGVFEFDGSHEDTQSLQD